MQDEGARLGVIADQLGYQLRRLDMLAMQRLHSELGEIGLTPARASALVFVALNEGCDQTALGRALGVNRASAMATVNLLVALGAVERRAGRDRRSNALWLTAHGHRLRVEAETITAAHDAAFFAVLTSDERDELRRLIAKARERNGASAPRSESTTRAILRRVK